MRKSIPLSFASALILGAAGCNQPEKAVDAAARRPPSVEQALASVPDTALRARWRAAFAEGRIAPLESLRVSGPAVAAREPARAKEDSTPQSAPRALPAGTLADVRVYSTEPLLNYQGSLHVTSSEPGRLTGRLDKGDAITLLYRIPAPPGAAPFKDSVFELSLRQEIVGASLRLEIRLSNARGLQLFFLSDGETGKPYARKFTDPPLALRQRPPDGNGTAALETAYSGRSFLARPGDHRSVGEGASRLGFYLLSNLYSPSGRSRESDGDAYHVRLMLYRTP